MEQKRLGRQTVALARPPRPHRLGRRGGQKGGGRPPGRAVPLCEPGRLLWREELGESGEYHAAHGPLCRPGSGGADRLGAGLRLASPAICSTSASAPASPCGGRRCPFTASMGPVPPWPSPSLWRRCCWTEGSAPGAAAVTSSHFCSAERQYRTPLEYGSQRTPTAQWTVTGAGAVRAGDGGGGPAGHPRHHREDRGQGGQGPGQHGRGHGSGGL